uniref:hypothetical protein n=1 Tax=Paraburkholderia oxyphila TaxID=614212 RepID=UPI000489DED9
LDAFAFDVEKSADKIAAIENHIAEVDKACANLLALGKEWQFPVYLSNLKATFSLSPIKLLPAVAGGWKLGEPYGLTAATAVAAGAGLVSTLEIKADYGLRSARKPTSPYKYAYRIDSELR